MAMDEPPLSQKPTCKKRIGVYALSATAARLQPELIDNIIDLLSDDKETLATCALVCKSWVPASRYHLASLFSAFNLSPWGDEQSMLSSPACTIASAVQHLEIERTEANSDLQEVTSGLPNITHLTLHRLDVDEPFSALLSQTPFMNDLEHLVLIRIRFDTPDMFFELLRRCPRLQILDCCDVTFSYYPDLQHHPNNHHANDQDAVMSGLKVLKVAQSFRLLEYIAEHWGNSIPHLTTLRVSADTRRPENTPGRLLVAVGSSLQDLQLINSSLDISFADRNFPALTQLQSLTVHFFWAETLDFVQYMLHALRHLTSPCLQELTIFIVCIARGESPNLDVWSELGQHLESPRFLSTLLKLTIRFDVFTETEVVDMSRRFFAEMFPLCAKRGILHVDRAVWE